MSWVILGLMPVSPASNPRGKPQVLSQGYLSTANWGLLFQAFADQVTAFIIPVDYIIGFQSGQEEFLPFVTLNAALAGDRIQWGVEGYQISRELLTVLSKRFFGALVKVQRGEADYSERFVFDPTIKQEETLPPPPIVDDGPPMLLSEAQMAADRKAASGPSAQSRASFQDSPAGESDNLELNLGKAFDRNHLVVAAALDEFTAKLDRELDTLTKIGMKTLQMQDTSGAQRTIYRSAKLKEMRQRVNDLMKEWQAVSR